MLNLFYFNSYLTFPPAVPDCLHNFPDAWDQPFERPECFPGVTSLSTWDSVLIGKLHND